MRVGGPTGATHAGAVGVLTATVTSSTIDVIGAMSIPETCQVGPTGGQDVASGVDGAPSRSLARGPDGAYSGWVAISAQEHKPVD